MPFPPKPVGCNSCEYRRIGQGFCPDLVRNSGIANAPARLAVWAQSPGTTEIETGEPLTGPTGFVLDKWIIPRAGLSGVSYSKANCLRCHPPGNKYPQGKLRAAAEASCRQYDVISPKDFGYVVCTLHPAGVMRGKYDLLPLIVRDFARAGLLLGQGESVLVLMGLEALELHAPWLRQAKKWDGSTPGVGDWRGHFYPTKAPLDMNSFFKARIVPLADMCGEPTVALDLEWDKEGRITAGSLATVDKAATFTEADVQEGRLFSVLADTLRIVGHNLLGKDSDLDVLAKYGIKIPLDRIGDTMIAFHLLWPLFAGEGHLDLWTCASLHTDLPNWKFCRGEGHCVGACPVHDPAMYNLFDSWAEALCWQPMETELTLRGLL